MAGYIIGKVRFLADRTRPDIAVALGILSSEMKTTRPGMVEGVLNIFGYLKHSSALGLSFRSSNNYPVKLFGFCDASYNLEGDGSSRSGGCFYVSPNSGSIHSFSRKDHTVSHSSTEAEIKAIDEAIREIIFLREFLSDMACVQDEPTVLFVDNRSAVELSNCLKTKNNVRHINVRLAFIREQVNARTVEICFVRGESNAADILTKPLPHNSRFFREWLMVGIPLDILNGLMKSDVWLHNKTNIHEDIFVEEHLY